MFNNLSDVESENYDVSVLHDVFFSFGSYKTFFLSGVICAVCDEIIVLAHAKVFLQGTRDEVFAHADELTSVGLDVPQITHLMLALRRRGMPVPEGIYTVDAAKKALRPLLE